MNEPAHVIVEDGVMVDGRDLTDDGVPNAVRCWCLPKVEWVPPNSQIIIHRSWWNRMPPWGDV